MILVPLKPRGCNLWLSAAYRWFNHQCTGANRHRGRCCPSPFKPPLLRSQWQWSQVGSCSPCQQPLGLYPASFLSHFPLLVCWRGANSKRAQVHRPTSLTSPGEGQKTRFDIVSNLCIMKRPFIFSLRAAENHHR